MDREHHSSGNRKPRVLLIVKKHPIEKREDYRILEGYSNVLYIYEDVDINCIIPFVGLFFHYGSTSLVDAYLSEVPAVYVYSKLNKSWYSDLGWPSSRKTDVAQINQMVQEFKTKGISFVRTEEIKAVLKNVFDIEEGKPYNPSKKIAELILSQEPAQSILRERCLFLEISHAGRDSRLRLLSFSGN